MSRQICRRALSSSMTRISGRSESTMKVGGCYHPPRGPGKAGPPEGRRTHTLPEVGRLMRRQLVGRLVLVLLASAASSCLDFQQNPPTSPAPLRATRFVDVKVEYRQPTACENTGTACDNLVVFFGSWMKPGEEIYLSDVGGRVWDGVATHVPVNWPPADEPHLVRVFDPHLVNTPTGGVTAARLQVGGQAIYFFDSPGTPQESGLIYIDDDGVGRNPY
jgi:hypothetical protein